MGCIRAHFNENCRLDPMFRNSIRRIPLSTALGMALAASALAACAPTVDQRGNLPEADKVAEIRPGATTRDEVAKILGTPSSTAVFDNKTWYYIRADETDRLLRSRRRRPAGLHRQFR